MRYSNRDVPSFSLYGERIPEPELELALHIEDIPSRSRKYLWTIATHRHTRLSQFIFLAAGGATVFIEGSRTEFSGAACVIVPAGTVHGFHFSTGTRGYVLSVDLDRLLEIATASHSRHIRDLFSSARLADCRDDAVFTQRMLKLQEVLHSEFSQRTNFPALHCQWLGCSVLAVAADHLLLEDRVRSGAHPEICSRQDTELLRRYRLLIETEYLRHWPVERYARQLGTSETTLNRVCRRLCGTTAFNLAQQRLALESRRRLSHSPGTINAIAADLGFNDAAYFSRFFRRHSGVSPNEYRRRQGGG